MATKKHKKKKQTKRTKAVGKAAALKKKIAPSKKLSKNKASSKKAAPKRKLVPRKFRVRGKRQRAHAVVLQAAGLGARSGGQSGDLQGLSNAESAASESVDELLEEGNALEAEVVKGVEDATDADEIVTHEVPQDDVPEEYKDR